VEKWGIGDFSITVTSIKFLHTCTVASWGLIATWCFGQSIRIEKDNHPKFVKCELKFKNKMAETTKESGSSSSHDANENEANCYPWSRSTLEADQPFIVIMRRGDMKYGVAKSNQLMQSRLGTFGYDDVLEKSFGSQWISRTQKQYARRGQRRKKQKMAAAASHEQDQEEAEEDEQPHILEKETLQPERAKGRLHILACTPELWCRSLLHRTQIIYSVDSSLICFHLDLIPGKVVVESGTGSGSLSLAMARAVAPTGHINTYEFNEARVTAAKEDFKLLGVDDLVTVRQADASEEAGFFGSEGKCDAVFLDLPRPWSALQNCIKALKTDVETRLCSFSPCIEQVQKTCDAMRDLGFFQIRTFECVIREFETYRLQERTPSMWEETQNANQLKIQFNPSTRSGSTCVYPEMPTHTGYLTFCSRFPLLKPNSEEVSKLLEVEIAPTL
jgi:tRNA (adenine57-N1/adenine58-N1)-methyltransferase